MPVVLRRLVRPALLALGLAACSAPAPRATSATGVYDDFGTPVRAGTPTNPRRIVSLDPSATELLFALGAGPRLVGRTSWDLWSDSARLVPDLGPGLRPNVEAVLARRPDLVILYASNENRAAATRLQAAHVDVIALKNDRIADFRRAALVLGIATGETTRARITIDTVARTLARVRATTESLPHPTVFWHIWDAPVITIGRGSYLSELVTIAGGRNLYDDRPQVSPQVSIEDIVRRRPEFILAGPEGAARLRTSREWQAVDAVRNGRVLVVDTMLVARPSVRLGEAAVHLARLLHPGALP